jgi:hypothetical protein
MQKLQVKIIVTAFSLLKVSFIMYLCQDSRM